MNKFFGWIETVILSLLAVFLPIEPVLAATGALIFADLITGVLAARKRGEPITSGGLRRTISKGLIYESAIMLAFLAEHYVSNVMPFVKMTSAMIAMTELKSCFENLNDLSGQQLLKALIDKLGSSNK